MKKFLKARQKAIAGFVAALIGSLLVKAKINGVDPALTAIIAGAIVAGAIERIPNK